VCRCPRPLKSCWKPVPSCLIISVLALVFIPQFASAQPVINYPSGFAGSSGQIFFANNAYLSGSQIVLLNGGIHEAQRCVQTG
jgi:hypothetical protein